MSLEWEDKENFTLFFYNAKIQFFFLAGGITLVFAVIFLTSVADDDVDDHADMEDFLCTCECSLGNFSAIFSVTTNQMTEKLLQAKFILELDAIMRNDVLWYFAEKNYLRWKRKFTFYKAVTKKGGEDGFIKKIFNNKIASLTYLNYSYINVLYLKNKNFVIEFKFL